MSTCACSPTRGPSSALVRRHLRTCGRAPPRNTSRTYSRVHASLPSCASRRAFFARCISVPAQPCRGNACPGCQEARAGTSSSRRDAGSPAPRGLCRCSACRRGLGARAAPPLQAGGRRAERLPGSALGLRRARPTGSTVGATPEIRRHRRHVEGGTEEARRGRTWSAIWLHFGPMGTSATSGS
jgi:hypothetical protein